jgi:hypothetical protein
VCQPHAYPLERDRGETDLGEREQNVEEPPKTSPLRRRAERGCRIHENLLATVFKTVLDVPGANICVGKLEVLKDFRTDVGEGAKIGDERQSVLEEGGGEGRERFP